MVPKFCWPRTEYPGLPNPRLAPFSARSPHLAVSVAFSEGDGL